MEMKLEANALIKMGSNQSLPSKDFPLNNFPVLIFVPAGSAKTLSRNEMTSHLQLHFERCEFYLKIVTQGQFSISAKGKNASRSHSQVSISNSLPCEKTVMFWCAILPWGTETHTQTKQHCWCVRAISNTFEMFCSLELWKTTATRLLFTFNVS